MDYVYEKIVSIVKETIVPVIGESVRIAPDALIYGTATLSFLTQSYPLAILLIAILEIALGNRLISTLIGKLRPDLGAAEPTCRQGFPHLASISTVLAGVGATATIPHFTIVLLFGIATYLNIAMGTKADALTALGDSWAARIPTSLSLTVVMLATLVYALVALKCVNVGNAAMSSLFGIILGFLAYVLNDKLFGPEATNFHGIPLLVDKLSAGEPVYVCSRPIA